MLVGQIHQYRAGLKDGQRFSTACGLVIHDSRHPSVGTNLRKFWLKLVAGSDVEGNQLIGDAQLVQEDCYLASVRRGPVVKIKHTALRSIIC
jgi:hypothetical protein